MADLNVPHALALAVIATLVGVLSLFGLRTARAMTQFPGQYREMLLKKESTHPLAILWTQPGCEESIRSWGIALSRLAVVYAVFSIVTAGALFALVFMERAGMHNMVGPMAKFLTKFEAGLAC